MEEAIVSFMRSHGLFVVYSAVFVSSFLEYVFPPFPSDMLLLIAGVLAGEKLLDPFVLFVITVIGSVIGAVVIYEISLKKGRRFFMEKNYSFFPREAILKLEDWFARHGGKIIIVNRFLSGFRAVFFIAAGIGRMGLKKVIIYGGIASAIWTGFVLAAGYLFGQNWGVIRKYFGVHSTIIVILVMVVFLLFFLRNFVRKRRAKRAETDGP